MGKRYTAEEFIKSDGTGGFLKTDGSEDTTIYETALGFTPENVANKSDSYTSSSSTTYASTKALIDGIQTRNYALTENPPTEINTATWDGFPLLFQTKTGKVILVYKSGVSHGGAGSSGIRTSTDGGKNFSSYTALVNEAGKYNGISGGGITPAGRVVLFYFIATPGVGTDEMGYFYSDDDAVTWSSRITVPMGSNTGGGFTGKMIEISNDKLMQCWWGGAGTIGAPATVHNLYALFSTDNGTTWGNQTVIATGTYGTNDPYTEASFVSLEGGNIVGLVRKDAQDFYSQVKSEDNGLTWVNQGDVTFENLNDNPSAPELQTYTDLDGKKTVIAYFANRIDLTLRSILGRNLLSGVSGWLESTETVLRSGLTNYDMGYPSAIHPKGSRYGLVAYYEAKNLTDDSDIQFVKSTFDDNFIIPNVSATFLGQVKAASFRSANLTDGYFPKATTAGQLINSTLLSENGTTLNVNNPGNSFGRFYIKDGTDINVAFKLGQTNPSAMMMNFVNDALTANIPAEFRATSFEFNAPMKLTNLTGTGSRLVYSDATGNLSASDTPTVPTAAAGTNTTQIATTAFVHENTVTNTTTVVLDSATLTATYPTAIRGFKVHALDIIVGGRIYEKTSTGWCEYLATITV